MEVIRGREKDCRQEVRGAVERGGTRPTGRVDPQRQAFRPAADEGPHPVEGRCIAATAAAVLAEVTEPSGTSHQPVTPISAPGTRDRTEDHFREMPHTEAERRQLTVFHSASWILGIQKNRGMNL
jgi:hypothetical protein